jgi:hypothetical protein
MAIGMNISDTARPLSDFAFTPKKPKKTTVMTEIHKGVKKKQAKHTFVAQMKNGHIGIFERDSSKTMQGSEKRAAIRQLPGPSVTGLFKASEERSQVVWDIVFNKFEERVEHELGNLLNG